MPQWVQMVWGNPLGHWGDASHPMEALCQGGTVPIGPAGTQPHVPPIVALRHPVALWRTNQSKNMPQWVQMVWGQSPGTRTVA